MKLSTFVKWAGGKTQLLEQYKKYYPEDFNNYHEPFLGSAAVFFHIKSLKYKPKKCYLSDTNKDLINVFNSVKRKSIELIELLKEHKNKDNNKEYFNEQREKYNKIKSGLEKSAIFIYLNKTCFNGLYRVNSKGKFNVPFGKYKNPSIVQESKILEASKLLKDCKIVVGSFENVVKNAQKNDFIYFDPPYVPLSKTSNFTSYQKDVFLEKEQKELARVFSKLDEKECKVMLSNSDTEFITDLYHGFNIQTVKARRMINCVGSGRGAINEIVVTNY